MRERLADAATSVHSGDKWVNWRAGDVSTVHEIDGWDGDNGGPTFNDQMESIKVVASC